MDSEKELRNELAELNLLIRGLAKVPGFPAELLELISAKADSISRLALSTPVEPLFEEEEETLVSSFPVEEVTFAESCSPSELVTEAKSEDLDEEEDEGETDFEEDPDSEEEDEPVSSLVYDEAFSTSVKRVNEQLGELRLADLSKSLTLNDKFRFQRAFFENDSQKMSEAFSLINQTQSLEEALDFMRNTCIIDEESETFHDFCQMLNMHFANFAGDNQSH
jgi:hypothetical protein